MTPNPGYVIETASAGTESVMCIATDEDVMGQLPSALRVPPFTALQGVKGVGGVIQAYESALGSKSFSQATLEWSVASRRPARDVPGKSP